MLSSLVCPKVITLSGFFYSYTKCECQGFKLNLGKHSERISFSPFGPLLKPVFFDFVREQQKYDQDWKPNQFNEVKNPWHAK